jgi:hypothetical protein
VSLLFLSMVPMVLASAPSVTEPPTEKELASALSELAKSPEDFSAKERLRHVTEKVTRDLTATLQKALAEVEDNSTGHALWTQKALSETLGGTASLATLSYTLDLTGMEVDDLDRALLLVACARAGDDSVGLPLGIYAQCMADHARFDPEAAKRRAGALSSDPGLRLLVQHRLPELLALVTRRFQITEQRADPEDLQWVRSAVSAGLDSWTRDMGEPHKDSLAAVRDVEELMIFGAPDRAFASCRARIEPLATQRVAALLDGTADLASLAYDDVADALLDAMEICTWSERREFAAYTYLAPRFALEDYWKTHTTHAVDAFDRRFAVRGPRAVAVRSLHEQGEQAREAGRDRSWEQTGLLQRDDRLWPLNQAERRWRSAPGSGGVRGVIARLEAEGDRVRLTFASQKIPDRTYECWGSNRLTGAHVTSGGVAVTRDVQCGYRTTGTVEVTPSPVSLPRAKVGILRQGQLVELRLPPRPAEGDYFDDVVIKSLYSDDSGEKLVALMGLVLEP